MEQVRLAKPRRPVDEERVHGHVARMFHDREASLQRGIVAIALDKVLEGIGLIEVGATRTLLLAARG